MSNYNRPWKVEYSTDMRFGKDWGGGTDIIKIVDCYGTLICETSDRVYGPCARVAEYIVKCVNEADKNGITKI